MKLVLKMSEKMVRMSFTLPPSLRSDLDYLSARLGVTKSSLVSDILNTSLSDLRSLVEMVPDNPTEADMVRANGKSNEIIAERLRSYRKLEGDLFDDRDL
jgi:metal-responsive CopG/Arc/MetJ family transcriptional regulator